MIGIGFTSSAFNYSQILVYKAVILDFRAVPWPYQTCLSQLLNSAGISWIIHQVLDRDECITVMKLVCVVTLLLDSTLDHGNKQHQTRLKTMIFSKRQFERHPGIYMNVFFWIGTISFIVFPLGPYLISLPMDFGDLIDLISLPMDTYEVCAYIYIYT